MINENLFCSLAKAYLKNSDCYTFSVDEWKHSYHLCKEARMNGELVQLQKYYLKKCGEIFPFMFLDKVIPLLDKDGNAIWKFNFHVKIDDSAIFLFAIIGVNKRIVKVRAMASKDVCNSDFDLTTIITKHTSLQKSRINFPISTDKDFEKDYLTDEVASKSYANVTKPTQQPYATYHH